MITKTLGTTGADFTSINAWVSWVQANAVSGGNLTDDVTLDVLAVGVSPSASDTISGWLPGGSNFTTTLTSSGTNSANGNASVQTNPFYYNASNGSFIDYTSHIGLGITIDRMTVTKQQIRTAGYLTPPLSMTGSNINLTQSIIIAAGGMNGRTGVTLIVNSGTASVNNNQIVATYGTKQGFGIGFTGAGNATIADNTVVNWLYEVYVGPFAFQTLTLSANAFVTNTAEFGGNFYGRTTLGGTKNATTNASFSSQCAPLTSGITSLNTATAFQGSKDYRAKSGGALIDAGVTISGVTTDWAGTTRPQGSTPDIGAWELVQASAADTTKFFFIQTAA